ncbi:DNA gyrase/topoisomerase IV, A subunit, partial [Ancylostoma ceylanicum]
MAENEEENDQKFDDNNENNEQNEASQNDFSTVHSRNSDEPEDSSIIPVSGLYENWFLDYASYVILERAVPSVHDGFKPVQRRILHSMKEMDDGRYNKVANIIGNTMKYHPHGDASIGDALVQLGQKDLLIDCQGNWGNTLTGDGAAAPRYIEARLTKFANHVVFNPKTTNWLKKIDDVIVFFATGKMMVTKVSDKKFVGKGIVYANVWKKGDKRTIYHMMYQDGIGGPTMMKRFTVDSITRDTEYDLTRGTKGSKLLYFSVHPNGEREIVTVMLRPRPHIKRLRFDIDFGSLLIKGRSAAGNRVTKEIVQKIVQKEVGGSTLAARKIWFDEIVGRLNDDGR